MYQASEQFLIFLQKLRGSLRVRRRESTPGTTILTARYAGYFTQCFTITARETSHLAAPVAYVAIFISRTFSVTD